MIAPIPVNGIFSAHLDGNTWRVDCNGVTVVRGIPSMQYALLAINALQRLDLPWHRFPKGFAITGERIIKEALLFFIDHSEPASASSREDALDRVDS